MTRTSTNTTATIFSLAPSLHKHRLHPRHDCHRHPRSRCLRPSSLHSALLTLPTASDNGASVVENPFLLLRSISRCSLTEHLARPTTRREETQRSLNIFRGAGGNTRRQPSEEPASGIAPVQAGWEGPGRNHGSRRFRSLSLGRSYLLSCAEHIRHA